MKNIFLLSALYHALHQRGRHILSLTNTTLLEEMYQLYFYISISPLFPNIADA